MTFFDRQPEHLPKQSQYYFNILVISIAISAEYATEILPDLIEEIWFIDRITEARPVAVQIYIDDLDEDYDFELIAVPHCVVEITQDNEIFFEEMIDFGTEDPWRID